MSTSIFPPQTADLGTWERVCADSATASEIRGFGRIGKDVLADCAMAAITPDDPSLDRKDS